MRRTFHLHLSLYNDKLELTFNDDILHNNKARKQRGDVVVVVANSSFINVYHPHA